MYDPAEHTNHQDESEEEFDVFAEAEREMVVKTYSKETAASQLAKKAQEDKLKRDTPGNLAIVHGTAGKKSQHHRPMNSGSAGVLFVSSLGHDSSSKHLDSTGHARPFTSSNSSMDKLSCDGHGHSKSGTDSSRSKSSGALLDGQLSKKLAFERMMNQHVTSTSGHHHQSHDNSSGQKAARRIKPSNSNPSLVDGRRKSSGNENDDGN